MTLHSATDRVCAHTAECQSIFVVFLKVETKEGVNEVGKRRAAFYAPNEAKKIGALSVCEFHQMFIERLKKNTLYFLFFVVLAVWSSIRVCKEVRESVIRETECVA